MKSTVNCQRSTVQRKRPAFTLIELLITTTIIGLLATVGSVSYNFARVKARDAKRVADVRTIRNAIETYFEQNSAYPNAPADGFVLGTPQTEIISDAGITPRGGEQGIVYLQTVPSNVLPGGVPYVYRTLTKDGSPCARDCGRYQVTFSLESSAGELEAGPHLLTEEGVIGPESGRVDFSDISLIQQYVPTAQDLAGAFGTVQETAELAKQVADTPEAQTAATVVVAPVSFAVVAANVVAATAGVRTAANLGQVLLMALTQPFLFFTRRKRRSWGTVYNAATKVPLDLATVRLIDSAKNRVVAAKVTDKDGRYAFAAKAGTYRLEAVKPGFAFPSVALAGVSDDGHYLDIYHGTLIRAETDGQQITVNVPLDPEGEPPSEVRQLLSIQNKKQLRKAAAMTGPVLGFVALAITRSVPMLILFLINLFLYQLFKRMAEPPAPKSQGKVFDLETNKPVDKAVVRIFSLPYHKVLETRLTDAGGRYNFYVGNGKYYLTVTKPGYEKTETNEIDFTVIDKPTFIAADLPVRRVREDKTTAA